MATNSSNPSYLFLLLSCVALLNQVLYANSQQLGPLPNPQGCIQSFADGGVCFKDLLTNFGRPSEACCKALSKIEDKCWSSVLPFLNPYLVPSVKGLCSGAASGGGGGSSGGGFPFSPFLPFPFPGTPLFGAPPTKGT